MSKRKPKPTALKPSRVERDAALADVLKWCKGVEKDFFRIRLALNCELYSDLPRLIDPETRKHLTLWLNIFCSAFERHTPHLPHHLSASEVLNRHRRKVVTS